MEAPIPKAGSLAKLRQIIAIGIPAVIESLISVIIGAIDTKMVSGLGKGAVSAVSFTSQPKLILLSIFFAMGTAVSVFVAQALESVSKFNEMHFRRLELHFCVDSP